jgi:hypothetical protein
MYSCQNWAGIGSILIESGKRPLVHCNLKRIETLLQALGLVWDD